MLLRQLHNYIKNHYQNGDYAYDYQTTTPPTASSDYQQGYQQALADYKSGQMHHHYPHFSMILLNTLSNNKAIEISEFIRGYRAGKKTADKAH
ncbi:hypothetical protein FE407_00095 [Leuconostoc carnosum]|uniref:hypothetical protein n=1 Tax=Leuconostoc TaxID=1243 RepID=UPI000D518C9C|nr:MULTISPECIES: hypothetical protein [Leuconostoc]KAA8327196.1 hypothetical protein FE404_00095 [Leuconostoc carnosum]KAA8364285.1 hypothetical protein FE407_00095 [Leuconostoc carnosum]KAA8367178.1 hypothetical protein FE406_00095 [Leuconostoc carnosum]KAA8369556.1 hypothetical protein FE416_00095 [Leuconostoc carnosum]KAA8375003.1 hypothetical protein FE412_00095 [Leuconostoc carnosum]